MAPAKKPKSKTKTGKKPAQAQSRRTLWTGVLILGVAVWMFFLGILVGRGTAPVHFDIDRLEQELASLRETLKEKERQLLATSRNDGSEVDLTFYDDLKQSEEKAKVIFKTPPVEPEALPLPLNTDDEPAGTLSSPSQGETATAGAPPPSPSDAGPSDSESAAAPAPTMVKPKKSLKKETYTGKGAVGETLAKKAPAASPPKQQTVKPVKSKTTTKANGRLTVQVASLKDAGTANTMVAKLTQLGYDAYNSIARVPGQGIRYRVRVGNFSRLEDARDMARRLADNNYKALVVNR